jgi:hypothetical protein
LLGQIITLLLDREHRPTLPLLGLLFLLLNLGLEFLLVGDGGGNLLLGLGQLTAHVANQLVEHLLRVFRLIDEVVDVRFEQSRQAIEDPHNRSLPI